MFTVDLLSVRSLRGAEFVQKRALLHNSSDVWLILAPGSMSGRTGIPLISSLVTRRPFSYD